MSTAKQRIIVLAGLVVLLIAAPILNYAFNNNQSKDPAKTVKPGSTASTQTGGSVTTGSYFVDYLANRTQQREAELKYLDSILDDTKTDADTRKTAQQQKADIAASMEKELTVENLLKAKGFDKVVLMYHKGSVNVVVGKKELTEAEVAQILDVVKKETGEKAENIRVLPVN